MKQKPPPTRLAKVIGSRYGLTAEEVRQLRGRTTSELAAESQRVVASRDVEHEGHTPTGKAAAAEALAARVTTGHPRTNSFLARVADEVARSEPSEDEDPRRTRIRERLHAAGYLEQESYGQ